VYKNFAFRPKKRKAEGESHFKKAKDGRRKAKVKKGGILAKGERRKAKWHTPVTDNYFFMSG